MDIRRDELTKLFSRSPASTFVVVGDFILDHYVWGPVNRISPEAPVPVVEVSEETYRLGGALNVAANFAALGARVSAVGVLGRDFGAETIDRLCSERGIELAGRRDPQINTIRKTRVIAQSQQLMRIDRHDRQQLPEDALRAVQSAGIEKISKASAVVLSDYGKGVLDKPVLKVLLAEASRRNIPCVVDPKIEHFWEYTGATMLTPNTKEAGAAVGRKLRTERDIVDAGNEILKRLNLKSLLITRGEQGMSVFEPGREPAHIPTRAREVFDVTGAGDTVTTVAALCLALGLSCRQSAEVANAAAGVVVGKIGTSTLTPDELLAQLYP